MNYLFCFLLIVSAAACICPEKDSAIPYKSFDQPFLNYTAYKTGSYWIYKEQASGNTDSAYIASYFKTTLTDSDLSDQNVNSDKLTMSWVIEGETWNGESSVYKKGDDYVFIYRLKNPAKESDEVLYDHLTVKANHSIINTAFHASIGHTGTYAVRDTVYSDVKVFAAASEDRYFKKVYWAAHAGIIRMELKNGRVWELLRYKAVQLN